MSVGIGWERGVEIYGGGARGSYPRMPVSFERLEQAARRAMPPEVEISRDSLECSS
jgi:hypothetical protein